MADAYDAWKDSDSEDEVGEEEQLLVYKPSYLLISIDTHESMFVKDESGKSPFMHSVEACYNIANSLVLAARGSVKGPLGIIFAENKMTKANFIDFKQSLPESIRILKELKDQSNEDLKARYERTEDFDLGDFFLFCKNKFLSVKGDAYQRNVVYLTNNDDPVGTDSKLKFKIKTEIQKFTSLSISLFIFSYKSDFNDNLFYGKLLHECNTAPVETVIDKSKMVDKLSSFVRHKYKKYRHKLYPFHENTEIYIDIVDNKFFPSSAIPKNMHVTRDTEKEVKKSMNRNKQLIENYTLLYSKPRSKSLLLNQLEKAKLKETNVAIGYTLICIGDETYKDGWIIEPPVFLEKHYQESELMFNTFWEYCKEKGKCLKCLRKFRAGGDIRTVEMVPRFVNGSRMFLVRILPYSLDVSHLSPVKNENCFSNEEEAAMINLVNSLTILYTPSCFNDPVEGSKEAYIKSQLLKESSTQEIQNGFISDKDIDSKIAPYVGKLKQMLNSVTAASASKRPAKAQCFGKLKQLKKE